MTIFALLQDPPVIQVKILMEEAIFTANSSHAALTIFQLINFLINMDFFS